MRISAARLGARARERHSKGSLPRGTPEPGREYNSVILVGEQDYLCRFADRQQRLEQLPLASAVRRAHYVVQDERARFSRRFGEMPGERDPQQQVQLFGRSV